MSRVKVKAKKMAIGPGGDDAANVLESLLNGDLDIGVAYPKYKNVAKYLEAVAEALSTMVGTPIFMTSKFAAETAEIKAYCDEISQSIKSVFFIDMDKYTFDLKSAPKELQDQFKSTYPEWKKLTVVRQAIETCDSLFKYADKLKNPSIEFIHNIPGNSWCPLVFTKLNFKDLFVYIDPLPKRQAIAEVIFTCMKVVFKYTEDIYNAYSGPDIDVQNFVSTVIDCMSELKKVPELSRCKEAFKHIRRSAKLFETNFTSYYKDFADTKDAKIILQNFITDVSQQANYDPETLREFQQIIKFYQKKAQTQGASPQATNILNSISEQMARVNEMAPNLSGAKQKSDQTAATEETAPPKPAELSKEERLRQEMADWPIEKVLAFINSSNQKKKRK